MARCSSASCSSLRIDCAIPLMDCLLSSFLALLKAVVMILFKLSVVSLRSSARVLIAWLTLSTWLWSSFVVNPLLASMGAAIPERGKERARRAEVTVGSDSIFDEV